MEKRDKKLIEAAKQQIEEGDFAFLKEMGANSLMELIRVARHQAELKGGLVNESYSEQLTYQLYQITNRIEGFGIEVKQLGRMVMLFAGQVNQAYSEQLRGPLCSEQVEQIMEHVELAYPEQVNQLMMQVNQLMKQFKPLAQQVKLYAKQAVQEYPEQVEQQLREQLCPVQVKQQVRGQLCSDSIIQFTKQCLRPLEPDEYDGRKCIGVSTTILYRLYAVWCEIKGLDCTSQRTFTMAMKSLGYRKDKGTCLVKSYVTGQIKAKQQIFFHYVLEIKDIQLLEQVREKLYKELLECAWPQDSEEYQQPHTLFVWFNKKDK